MPQVLPKPFGRLLSVGLVLSFFLAAEVFAGSKPESRITADSSAAADSLWLNPMTAFAPSARAVETFFWHDIALYNWLTRINLQQTFLSSWQLGFSGNFASTLQQQPGVLQPERWKDEQNAQLVLRRNLLSGWQWQIAFGSQIFRDDFSQASPETRNNDSALSGFYSRLERQVRSNLWLSGQAGYRLEQLLGRNDHGLNLRLDAAMAPTLWQGYSHRLNAEAELNRLADRHNDDMRLSYSISRQFENATSDSLLLHVAYLRRDNYFADAKTLYVDMLSRNRRGLENRLDYRLNNHWHFALHSGIGESQVEVARRVVEAAEAVSQQPTSGQNDSTIQHIDFDTYHDAKLLWRRSNLHNEFSVQFFSQTIDYSDQAVSSPLFRRYAGVGYDSEDWYFRLAHRLHWRIGRKDSLRWYGSAERRAHEISNPTNPDDFDRLTYQANLLYAHHFSRIFLMLWEANAYLEHHVYLKSSHSAGNNWRRVFKLQPSCIVNFAPRFYLKQSFGVLAQYIAYDFPEPLAIGQSNVFRNFFIADSLFLQLSRRTHCVAQYRLRLEERGHLDWENWRQRPWFDRHEHWAALTFNHQPARSWQISPGITYLRQSDWAYRAASLQAEGLTRYRTALQTIWSPSLTLSYVRSLKTVIIFSAQRQIVFYYRRNSSSIDNVRLTVQWAI